VSVASEGLGKGAEFTVTLPLSSAPSARAGGAVKPMARDSLRGAKVLVVDDEPDARDVAARFLQEHGAAVAAAGSAREALAILAKQRIDVVVSDIGMPEIDGYELARRLGAIPAIALTAFARPEDKERAMAAGFRAHVPKPVEAAELVAAVATLRAP
jgi:CheY-like chemotaxis protein